MGWGEIKLKKQSTGTLTPEEAEEHRKFTKTLSSRMKISTVEQNNTTTKEGIPTK